MNEYNGKVVDDDVDDDEEYNWAELLREISKKHGNIPPYLYRAINKVPNNSSSIKFIEPCSHLERTDEFMEDEEGDALTSPESHRRSPEVDSGCSVGFNDDDDEAEEKNRRENTIKKILTDLHAIRQTTISLTKQFINIFDVIEDVKYTNESISSRESLSSCVSGSHEYLSLNQRHRRYHLRRFSRSVPNARGACSNVINRQNRKPLEDVRLRLFDESLPPRPSIHNDDSIASTEGEINKMVINTSPRRASDDSVTMSPRKNIYTHHRSSSLTYGEKKEDEWMQHILELDNPHRSVPTFADLVRAQTEEIENYFKFDDLPKKTYDKVVNSDNDSVERLDDTSELADEVLESQPNDGIEIESINDQYYNHETITATETFQEQSSRENHDTNQSHAPHSPPLVNIKQSPPYSTQLDVDDSPRKSWLHGIGRYSYHERREKAGSENDNISRSRSFTEKLASAEDDQKHSHADNSTTKPPRKTIIRKLPRSPLFINSKKYIRKEDEGPISPRYKQLLLMLEEGQATDL